MMNAIGSNSKAGLYILSYKIGIIEEINQKLSARLRRANGREATPNLASLDSQTVKITKSAGSRGFDGGKKIKGRKRYIIVDTLGLVIGVVVHTADIGERSGARLLLASLKYPLVRFKKILVDKGYSGAEIGSKKTLIGSGKLVKVQIIRRDLSLNPNDGW